MSKPRQLRARPASKHIKQEKIILKEPGFPFQVSENHDVLSLHQLIHSYQDTHFPNLQTLERLTRIPDFIPDRIFPFLCGRDQLQLANSSPVLLRELHPDLPPKIICRKCLKTLISSAFLPPHVRFLLSASPATTTVAVTLCRPATQPPFDSDDMKWAREKFFVGDQQHKGSPILHCKRCRNIVSILLSKPIDHPGLKSLDWMKTLPSPDSHKYQFAQLIVSFHSGTKYIES